MKLDNTIVELNRFYPVVEKLPSGLQHALLDSSVLLQAGEGEILCDVHETIHSFIMLTRGAVRVIRPGKEREILLYRVQPGDCCAISICHLLGNTQYRARAQVETAIQGVAVPQPLFNQMMEQSPLFSTFILRTLAERVADLADLLESVTFMRLDERLAVLLLSRGSVIKTTHSLLADELGSVREVISRILKDFEVKGMIKAERGCIQILDAEALRNVSQFRDSGH